MSDPTEGLLMLDQYTPVSKDVQDLIDCIIADAIIKSKPLFVDEPFDVEIPLDTERFEGIPLSTFINLNNFYTTLESDASRAGLNLQKVSGSTCSFTKKLNWQRTTRRSSSEKTLRFSLREPAGLRILLHRHGIDVLFV